MRSIPSALVVALGCALAAGACTHGDVLEPAPPPGSYALVSVDGHALPATVVPPGGPRTYLDGTLTLDAGGSFAQVTHVQRCAGDGNCTVGTSTNTGTWSVLPDGSLSFAGSQGTSDPPQLVLLQGDRITFCEGAAGSPCVADEVYERR